MRLVSEYLEYKLVFLLDQLGCYLMKNVNVQIIYVGKVKNLKNWVWFYFKFSYMGKVVVMVEEVVDFEMIVIFFNKEFFLLEIILI